MDNLVIFHAHPITLEFLGTGEADPDPRDADNWLIPAFAYQDEPPQSLPGHVVVRSADHSAWQQVEDNRGTVYDISTGEAHVYQQLGPLPDGLTREPFPGTYYVWSGSAWVLDEVAQLQGRRTGAISRRDELLAVASARIEVLQDAIELSIATEEEKSLLLAWKTYRVNLSRVETQEGFPLLVTWPPAPDVVQTAP